MSDQRTATPRAHWQGYVARSGPLGRSWVEAFQTRGPADLLDQTDAALALLHRKQSRLARQKLDAVSAGLRGLTPDRPSIPLVLGRFYHGVLAYYFYAEGAFDQAHAELHAADRCVRNAVDADRFLLPLAYDCHEFRLHHARIARNRRRWSQMREHVADVREMIENRCPLCELTDGTRVDFEALARHYEALPLDDDERRALIPILNIEHRRRLLDRFLLQMYYLPGFVVSPS